LRCVLDEGERLAVRTAQHRDPPDSGTSNGSRITAAPSDVALATAASASSTAK
jgi:hypothetical protein